MDISWLKMNPANIFNHSDWMLSRFRTTSSRRSDPTVLGTEKQTHRNSILWPTTARKRWIKKNFDGIHDRFQRDPVYRDSQLKIGWTEEKCIEADKMSTGKTTSQWISWHRKTTPTAHPLRNMRDIGETGIDFRTAVTVMNRLHRQSGEERPEPIPFQQYQRWHPSSCSSSTSWWNWDEKWWSSFFYLL